MYLLNYEIQNPNLNKKNKDRERCFGGIIFKCDFICLLIQNAKFPKIEDRRNFFMVVIVSFSMGVRAKHKESILKHLRLQEFL